MPAYSVFALGTYENTENESNIISQFYHACESAPGRNDKLILNGPQQLIDPTAVEKNVDLAVRKILTWLAHAQPDTDGKFRINLAGFSRGGVTCVRIANRLYQYLEQHKLRNAAVGVGNVFGNERLELNIFAVDPVAGLFEKYKKNSQNLPPIVRNYESVLMTDEFRNDLGPMEIKRIHAIDPSKTRIRMHPLFGHHCSSKKIVGPSVDHCTKILWQQMFRFLKKHGTSIRSIPSIPHLNSTEFERADVLNDLEILELFGKAKSNRAAYEAIGDWSASLSGNGPRGFLRHLHEYVSNSDFFLNQFELELFKRNYPDVMSYLFEGGANHGYRNELDFKTALVTQLKKIHIESPALFATLQEKGVTYSTTSGIYRFPPAPTGHVPLDVADIAIRRLFRYRHSKPEWKAFSTNDEYDRTVVIENAINEIRASRAIEKREKLVLDLIEKHAREIYESGSSSRLLDYLLEVLEIHHQYYHLQPNVGLIGCVGKLVELLGSTVKKLSQGAAFTVGASGTVTEFCGNLLRFGGKGMASVFYWTKVFIPVGWLVEGTTYLVGSGVSKLGRGIKAVSKELLSPFMEWIGKKIRDIGQGIVSYTDSFKLTLRVPPATRPFAAIHSSINPELKKLSKRPERSNHTPPGLAISPTSRSGASAGEHKSSHSAWRLTPPASPTNSGSSDREDDFNVSTAPSLQHKNQTL